MPKLWDPYKHSYDGTRTIEVSQEAYDELMRLASSWHGYGYGCRGESPTGWLCVLRSGHEGDHIASGDDEVFCTWPQECATAIAPRKR